MSRIAAHIVSWVFNPGTLVLGLLILGVIVSPLSLLAKVWWMVGYLVATGLGGLILLISWAHGLVIDADLTTPINLRDRTRVLLLFLAILALMMFASFQADQVQPLHTILITLLVIGAVVASITLVWKISLHMLGVGTLTAALLLIFGPQWWPVSVLVPLVAWARLRLHRHTPYQLVGGFVVGVAITSIIFWSSGLV